MNPLRRRIIGGGSLAMLAPALAQAQPSARLKRVAIQPGASLNLRYRQRTAEWFAEEGFVEGRNLALEYVDLDLSGVTEIEQRARAIVASRPDVILVPGGDSIALFKGLTKDIPIVFYAHSGDSVRMGLVESYRRPGGNVTGTADQGIEATALKAWELLRELRPKARRAGVLWDEVELKAMESYVPQLRGAQSAAASRLELESVEIVVPSNEGFAPVERAIRAARIDVLDVLAGNSVPWIPELMRFLERTGIPARWYGIPMVRRGGLFTTYGSVDEACREAVSVVARILRGASPATMPVHVTKTFITAMNLGTARAMGLEVPPSVMLRATIVIE